MRRHSFRVALIVLFVVSSTSSFGLAATHTWTGATNSFWSDSSNWIGGSPAGDPIADLVFPPSPTRLTSTNDIAGVSFINSITFNTDGYVVDALAGSSVALAGGILWNAIAPGPSISGQVVFAVPVMLYGGAGHYFSSFGTTSSALFIWSGKISGGVSDGLSVNGGLGTVQLTGTNDYTGSTAVGSAGVGPHLQVDGSQPLSSVKVDSTLNGSGTIGPLDLGTIATVQPGGVNTGILSVVGDTNLSGCYSTSKFRLNGPDPGTGYDQLLVDGSVFIGPGYIHCGPNQIRPVVGFTPTAGLVFSIIKSTGPISASFLDGTIITADCHSFRIDVKTNEVTLTAVAAPPPPITSVAIATSGSRTVCPTSTGGTVDATDAGGCSSNTHQWGYRTTSGGAIADMPGRTLATYTLSGADFPAPGSYYLVCASTPPGGASVVSNELFVTVTPPPIAVASGSAAICAGESTPLSGSGAASCRWFPATGLSDPNSCAPIASPTASTVYSLVVTGTTGCVSTNTATASVTVKSVPSVPIVQAPTTVGAGALNQVASVEFHPGSNYQWGISNGTITAGAGTSSVLFNPGVTGVPLVLSVVEESGGCLSPTALSVISVLNLPTATSFAPVTPCRVLDTRTRPNAPLAGPALQPGSTRSFPIPLAPCGIPTDARAVSANMTVTNPTQPGSLTLYPADEEVPATTSITFRSSQTRANNVLLKLSADGAASFNVFSTSAGTVDFILDVNGYFR